MARLNVVLVGVDSDTELAGIGRGLEDAEPSAARSVVDDVSTTIEL